MILGIDPGLANVGWAVIERCEGEMEAKLVDCGCFETKPTPTALRSGGQAGRLCFIDEKVGELIDKFKIREMAVESLFFARNAKSAIKVAEAIGVIKVAGARRGLLVFDYTPLQIKMTLVGYGQAEKEQVAIMVKHFLGLEENIKPEHASDAAAAALTHLFTNQELVTE